MAIEKFGKFDIRTTNDIGQQFTPSTTELVAQMMYGTLRFAKSANRDLYVYDEGIYRFVGDDIKACLKAIYRDSRFVQGWTRNKGLELMEYLTVDAPNLLSQPLYDRIKLKNGLYFIEEERFEYDSQVDHSGYLTTVQIPIIYDPNATCPGIDMFLSGILPEGPELLCDSIGSCMTSDTRLHKCVVMKGGGNNGKSLFLLLIREFIGAKNVATNSLHNLCNPKDKFINATLLGKLANTCDDTRQDRIQFTENLKSVISGNPITVEEKYKNPVVGIPFCKLFFSTNHDLVFEDDSIGLKRRIIEIPFVQKFRHNTVKEQEFKDIFSNPNELSGLFNRIRARLKRVMAYGVGFDMSDELNNIIQTYVPTDSESEKWFKEALVEDPNGVVPVWRFFVAQGLERDIEADSPTTVTKMVKQLFPSVTTKTQRYNGRPEWCYVGVRIINSNVEGWLDTVMDRDTVLDEISYLDPET